jgi:hypothetical protein
VLAVEPGFSSFVAESGALLLKKIGDLLPIPMEEN